MRGVDDAFWWDQVLGCSDEVEAVADWSFDGICGLARGWCECPWCGSWRCFVVVVIVLAFLSSLELFDCSGCGSAAFADGGFDAFEVLWSVDQALVAWRIAFTERLREDAGELVGCDFAEEELGRAVEGLRDDDVVWICVVVA